MHNCNNASCCDCTQEVQKYSFYQEYPIGSLIETDNEIYKVVMCNKRGGDVCENCDFNAYMGNYYCDTFVCRNSDRIDGKNVIAILYDNTLEENE